MGKIVFLPQAVVSKTAAGEVIENPASVVKELIENALDAGATSVKISISDGGKKKIIVADDGEGMSREDLLICHKPHTSGRISTEADLGNIKTFGFRGEALNSIACVSALSIKSFARPNDISSNSANKASNNGWQINLSYGDAGEMLPVGMPYGTIVEVQDLFANFPARQQFLKTSQYEFQKILDTVMLFVLAYSNVSFSLAHNDKPVLEASAYYDLAQRLSLIFGNTNYFLPLDSIADHLALRGFITAPQKSSNSFADIYFYVNNRPIKWHKGLQRVKKAYGTLLERRKYPKGVLFLTLPPEFVDVNVHPRKEEVRFKNENLVLDFLEKSVRDPLEKYNLTYTYSEAPSFSAALYGILKDSFSPWKTEQTSGEDFTGEVLQIAHTYLVASFEDKILFLDQHAAHEKILYAQILDQLKEGKTLDQVISDSNLDLTKEELASDYLDDLSDAAASVACKSAIKAGDYLTPEERVRLVRKLLETRLENYTCPHGRPTMIELSKHDLEKMFKRL
jgi:DNA mismatch repair protein MutL